MEERETEEKRGEKSGVKGGYRRGTIRIRGSPVTYLLTNFFSTGTTIITKGREEWGEGRI